MSENSNIAFNFKFPATDTTVRSIILIGWGIFAGIIAYNMSLYEHIDIHWRIAVIAFIFLLPFSLFLQALMNESATMVERETNLQKGLRNALRKYSLHKQERNEMGLALEADLASINQEIEKTEKLIFDIKNSIKYPESHDQRIKFEKDLERWESSQQDMKRRATSLSTELGNLLKLQEEEEDKESSIESIARFLINEIKDINLYDAFRQAEKFLRSKKMDIQAESFKLNQDVIRLEKMDAAAQFRHGLESHRSRLLNLDTEMNQVSIEHEKLAEFELGDALKNIVKRQMIAEGINFESYILPLSFFLFIYFTGFLITLPLINSVFTGDVQTTSIPLFDKDKNIPLVVVQWGFLGGLVYTSISLLTRFLRKDIVPRVYFNASFRLLLSAVVSIIIYFFYMLGFGNNIPPDKDTPAQLLLLCFAAGVAPIQFLIRFADDQFSKLVKGWKRRNTAGDRSVTQLEGINSITAERLSEEGYDYIQQLALCDPIDLANRTKFPTEIVRDWKDQAIFYVLTSDVIAIEKNRSYSRKDEYLNDILNEKLGIRRISQLLAVLESLYPFKEDPFEKIGSKVTTAPTISYSKEFNESKKKEEEESKEEKMSFFRSLGILNDDQKNFYHCDYLFRIITQHGYKMMTNYLSIDDISEMPAKTIPVS